MARLPQPGSDNGEWGDILNEYLSQTLKSDGTLKDNSVTGSAIADNAVNAATIQDGSITEAQLNGAVQTKLNASGGTPDWDDIAGKPVVIAAGADQAAARSAIGAGTSNLAIGTTGTTAKAGDYAPTKSDVGLGNVDNTSDAAKNNAVATVSNKTLDTSNTIRLNSSTTEFRGNPATKRARIDVSQVTDGATRVLSVPDADTTIVGTNVAQTLTNKTLVNPSINALFDANNNRLVDLVTIGSAVNHVYMTNQTTGNYPSIGTDGSDSNIGISLVPKGNGPINLFGNTPTIAAAGGYNGGNLNLNLKSQGTGVVQANDVPVVTTTAAATLTNKTISGSSNTLTNIGVPSLAVSGTPSESTYLRGDGSWATPSAAGGSGSGSVSGFPLRLPGEKIIAVGHEVAVARAEQSDPEGRKIIVLSETWDKPGILKHIWVACDNSATVDGFLEQGAVIRIFTDDGTVPAVSMSLGDFFCLSNRSDIFATPRVGRADRGTGGSAYRYLHMPFQKYLRVEIESLMASDTAFYGTADYSLIDSFADLGNQQLAYSIKGQRVASHPVQTPLTVCDFNGSGQVESIMVSFSGADAGDYGVLEGNIKIYVDNEQYPTWASSGMEDAFNGGWYAIPVGGYPAGRSGNSDQSGANVTMYRFFLDDPIFYNSHLKVVVWAGQPHQGSINSATVKFAGYVGVWSTAPVTPNYTAVDTAASAIADNQMNQAAGAVDSDAWHQDGSRTQLVATGSTFTVPYGNAGSDEDTRAALKNVVLPANYWVETRLRITDASHNGQEAHLIMLGATPDPFFGSAVHVQLRRLQQASWVISLRDDFSTPMVTHVGGGMDLTNMWVRLAFKKIGVNVTAYYSFNDAPSAWIPIGTWEATKSEQALGVGSWTAGAEFDYLMVRPLKSVTS